MEDRKVMKPGKPDKTVTSALRKSEAVSGGNNDPGRPSASRPRKGTNRGSGGAQGK